MRAICLVAVMALLSMGCTRVVVNKDPGRLDRGIRFYRPKPYLLITPSSAETSVTINQVQSQQMRTTDGTRILPGNLLPISADENQEGQKKEQGPPSAQVQQGSNKPRQISMQLVYMPDFTEEYSIQLRPGLGIGELQVQLENGWNLTSVGIKTDQQVDEIITSVAKVIEATGGLLPATKERIPLMATNVPFGFYEAVIARDPHGRKQLYGWRYIGFMPFQSCPTDMGGMQQVCCDDPIAIYGLVWVDGILQFQRIAEIPREPVTAQ